MTQSNRTIRLEGRAALRTITDNPRCVDCGRVSILPGGVVGVRKKDDVVGFSGLASCGSVWLCPMCNAKIMVERGVEIGAVLSWAEGAGLHVLWGSLTVRHTSASKLAHLLGIQKKAWRRVVSSKAWKVSNSVDAVGHQHTERCSNVNTVTGELDTDCERVNDYLLSTRTGRAGYIRVSEITVGRNGWHPHFHPIVLFQGTVQEAKLYAEMLTTKWVESVIKCGGKALGHGGQQVEVISHGEGYRRLASYASKATYDPAKLALEAVWSQSKNGKNRAWDAPPTIDPLTGKTAVVRTVSHWSLLAEIAQGLADACEQWGELEASAKGHRVVSWSRGIRQIAGLLAEERDDETIVQDEVGGVEDTVCVITGRGWRTARDNPEILGLMLDTLQASGWAGLRPILDQFGIEWCTPEEMALQDSDEYGFFTDEKSDEEYAAYWATTTQPTESASDMAARAAAFEDQRTQRQKDYDTETAWTLAHPELALKRQMEKTDVLKTKLRDRGSRVPSDSSTTPALW